jgi:DNA polymerase elongation subunit (family B)
VVLSERKVDYKSMGYESLEDLYERNPELFFDYNIQDTGLIDRFEEKLGFIELVMAFAYDAKVNYVDTMTTVKPWDIIVHNYLMDRCIVVPQFTKKTTDESLMGGHVKEVKPGMYRWVVSFDLTSLYPHLIMHYNISPETKIGREQYWPHLKSLIDGYAVVEDHGYSYAANGVKFSKQKQGFAAALMEKMFNDRANYKSKMLDAKKKLETTSLDSPERKKLSNEVARYHNLQLAKKIQLNSFYGALSNPYFRWFDFDMAEAITSSGQLTIQWVERYINEYLNIVMKTKSVDYIIASDTDSLYINMESLVNQLGIKDPLKIVSALDKFCDIKIQSVIKKAFDDLADYMHSYDKKMFMKRETIADKAIWKAAKMYILNAWNIEGVQFSEPQLKIQGIEAVRSSTPKVCRANIKKCLGIIMNSEEEVLHKFIEDFRSDFMKLPFQDVAFPRGMNGMDKYKDRNTIYSKGTPIHVKGALLYNHLIQKHNLNSKYELIGDGDKIKFCYLKLPNPLMEHVISVPDNLPEELDFSKYIDYDTQFNKSFLEPIKGIVEIIGWDIEKRSTLEAFF